MKKDIISTKQWKTRKGNKKLAFSLERHQFTASSELRCNIQPSA